MEVWKIVFHFIFEIFHSILASSIPKFSFHYIPFSIPCQVENWEAPDFEKIASASSSFSTLSLPSSLLLPTSFIKVLPLPQKIITASAATSLVETQSKPIFFCKVTYSNNLQMLVNLTIAFYFVQI